MVLVLVLCCGVVGMLIRGEMVMWYHDDEKEIVEMCIYIFIP